MIQHLSMPYASQPPDENLLVLKAAKILRFVSARLIGGKDVLVNAARLRIRAPRVL